MSGLTLAAESGADVSLSNGNLTLIAVVGVIAVIALAMAMLFRGQVLAAPEGTENMKTIGVAV
jgi:K(+)-stimulated pyrophosphate-energized sodium pump